MMKVLVTGGMGFVGSHLCEHLLKKGYDVTALDNLHTGSKDNIEHLLNDSYFHTIYANVEEGLFGSYDMIYNLACIASPKHYQSDPIKTMKTSVLGVINLLDNMCNKHTRILQASTSEVYGDPSVHPQVESYWGNVNTTGVRSCYDEGKRCAETILMDYHRTRGTDIKIARIFNTYGPHMAEDDGRVVSNFIIQALKGENLTVYGDGSQTRSFQYIDDLIEGLVRLMEMPYGFTGPVNIGNPGEFTILEFAQMVLKLTGSKSKVISYPLPQDDPKQRKPDITLARNVLGWEPQIPLEEGLIKTIEYFRKKLS